MDALLGCLCCAVPLVVLGAFLRPRKRKIDVTIRGDK